MLGVHIADVAHYVREGDPIDVEARRRGTSVYFTDQVVPMLPEVLSNQLCSLQPGEDRLTRSCLMALDAQGNLTDYELVGSVIRSGARCISKSRARSQRPGVRGCLPWPLPSSPRRTAGFPPTRSRPCAGASSPP